MQLFANLMNQYLIYKRILKTIESGRVHQSMKNLKLILNWMAKMLGQGEQKAGTVSGVKQKKLEEHVATN